MFFGKKEKKLPVGAKDKVELARMIAKGKEDEIKARFGNKKSEMTGALFVFGIAFALVFVMSEGEMRSKSLAKIFSDDSINRLLLGPGYPPVIGDPMIDQLLVVFIRALAFCAAAGFFPAAGWLVNRINGKAGTNPYMMVWGTTVGLVFAYYLFTSLLAPLFTEIWNIFFGG